MVNKTKTTKAKATKNPVSAKTQDPPKTKAVKTKTKTKTKRKSRKVVKPTPELKVATPDSADELESEQEPASVPVVAPTPAVPASKTTSLEKFDAFLARLDAEIDDMSQNKVKGTKFLRSLRKDAKVLRRAVERSVKPKQRAKKTNCVTGLTKKVPISEEMAKFASWDPSELKSRIDVNKFLCAYIKERELQDDDNRRVIVPDKKMARLLGYKKGDKPLTFTSMQTYVKGHFIKAKAKANDEES